MQTRERKDCKTKKYFFPLISIVLNSMRKKKKEKRVWNDVDMKGGKKKRKKKIFFSTIFESRVHPRRGISGHTLHKIRSLIVARCFYLSTARSTYSVQVTMSRNGRCIALTNQKKRVLERDGETFLSRCGREKSS